MFAAAVKAAAVKVAAAVKAAAVRIAAAVALLPRR